MSIEKIKECIRTIPDFPKPGILFYDITTVLQNAEAFRSAIEALSEQAAPLKPDMIVAAEARGFLFAAPLAIKLNCGLAPVRKPGKLPWKTISYTYDLEYGSDTLTMHEDAIPSGARVLVVDDLLATGGTAEACAEMVKQMGGNVVGYAFIIELEELPGREKLGAEVPVLSLLRV